MLIPYARQSRDRERSISIDEQLRSIRLWAESTGTQLAEPIVERGVSGSRSWRVRELGRAVEDCEQGRAHGIAVAFQDRLTREDYLGTAEVWTALERAGARLVATSEGGDVKRMEFVIKAEIARQQWERSRDNWRTARRRAIEDGVHSKGYVPFGYEAGADRRLVPVPEEAAAVRRAYTLRAQGSSWAEIAGYLDSTGLQPRQGWAKAREARGRRRWIARSVKTMLSNDVYLGVVRSGEFVNEDAHRPIVTRAEWLAAQRQSPGRLCRSPDGTRLAGLIYCASCGRRMTPSVSANSYRCLRRRDNRPPCESPAYLRMDEGDAHVVAKFLGRYTATIFQGLDDEDEVALGPLRTELKLAKETKDELLGDTEFLASLTSNERKRAVEAARARIERAQRVLDDVEVGREQSMVSIVRDFDLFYDPGDPTRVGTFRGQTSEEWVEATALTIPQQRRLLSRGIERIEVARAVAVSWTTA